MRRRVSPRACSRRFSAKAIGRPGRRRGHRRAVRGREPRVPARVPRLPVEAQLYTTFPLLLLIVRRWGPFLMVATVTLLVATVGVVGPHVSRLDTFVVQSPPDLAALFALGALTAGIVGAGAARQAWPWPWFSLAAAAPVFATILVQGSVWWPRCHLPTRCANGWRQRRACLSWHGFVVTGHPRGPNRRFGGEQPMLDRPYTLLSCGMSRRLSRQRGAPAPGTV
jgi:hypothetical protein